MKKLIMAMLIATFAVQTMSAQGPRRQRMTPEQRTEWNIQRLDKKLSLTDEQKTKIRDIYTEFNKQKPTREQFRESMEKLRTDIKAVLTPDQQKQYDEMQKEMAERFKNRMPRR